MNCSHYAHLLKYYQTTFPEEKNGPLLITLNCHLIQLPPVCFMFLQGEGGVVGWGWGGIAVWKYRCGQLEQRRFHVVLADLYEQERGGEKAHTKKQVCVNYVTQGLQDGLVSDVKWQVQLVAVKSTCFSVLITFSISDFGFTWTIWSLG